MGTLIVDVAFLSSEDKSLIGISTKYIDSVGQWVTTRHNSTSARAAVSVKRKMRTKWRRSGMSTKVPQQPSIEQARQRSSDHANTAYTGSRVASGSWSALTKSLSQLAGCLPLVPMRAIFFVSSLQWPPLSLSQSWSSISTIKVNNLKDWIGINDIW